MSVDASDLPKGEPSDLDREEFARLFSRNARRIYGFIMTLVFNHHDAEEVFQNTNVVLWNKFADFQPGSNFFAWSSKIAYYEALSLMKQQRRSRAFSEEALELLADAADYAIWHKNVDGAGGSAAVGDSEPDGDVDNDDYIYWQSRFGNPTMGSGSSLVAATVPEPGTLLLLSVAAMVLLIAAGRREKAALAPV